MVELLDKIAEKVDQAFAEAMRSLAVTRDYESTCDRLDAIEAEHVPALVACGARSRARALRVLCAYGRLCAAMEGHTLDQCEIHLARLLAFMPHDFYERPSRICAFAGHAITRGDAARALLYLVPLIEELERDREVFPEVEDIKHSLAAARKVMVRARAARE